jgi:chorismate mutase/prephenate dehydratase
MSKMSIVPARAPAPTSNTLSKDLTVEALRAEIDGVDDEILHLIQHRMRLAGRIGSAKDVIDAAAVSALKLRPDREARVIARRLERVEPSQRRLATAVWRELMSAGLSAQGQLEVAVWSGVRRDTRDAARGRFGGCADYRDVRTAAEALDAAVAHDKVAVLALDPDQPWWTELHDRPNLWIFEGLGRRGPRDPAALAIGRFDPAVLARGGVMYRVSSGGESGMEGRSEHVLAVSEGSRLCVMRDAGTGALDRDKGVIGCAPILG